MRPNHHSTIILLNLLHSPPPTDPSMHVAHTRARKQLRLASVRVIEAVCRWREDMQATRTNAALPSSSSGRPHKPKEKKHTSDQESQGAESQQQHRQQEEEEEVNSNDEAAGGVEPSPALHSGNDQSPEKNLDGYDTPLAPEVSAPNHKTRKRKKQTNRIGSGGGGGGPGGGESNPTEGGGGRVTTGRWVVTMMVPGRKLWDSSPAMMSQYKRFRRSRQDPKIARDQVWYSVYCTHDLHTGMTPSCSAFILSVAKTSSLVFVIGI